MRKLFVLLLVVCTFVVAPSAQQTTETPARFALTVDSIMRGPKLVGYAPSDLRWSGDSKELYFEWRVPGDEEAATWVVGVHKRERRTCRAL